MQSVETILLLVVLATVVATFARRLSIPAPSLLVVAGVVVGLLPGVPEVHATPELVSLVVLPPLIYAAGEEMPWRDLRRGLAARDRAGDRPGAGLGRRGRVGGGVCTRRCRRDGVRAGRGVGQHRPGGGERARATAVAAAPDPGAGAGGKPVQRRDRLVLFRWPWARGRRRGGLVRAVAASSWCWPAAAWSSVGGGGRHLADPAADRGSGAGDGDRADQPVLGVRARGDRRRLGRDGRGGGSVVLGAQRRKLTTAHIRLQITRSTAR